jgi:hypothetical protein
VVVEVVAVDLSNPPLTGEVLVVDVLLVVSLGGLAKATVANKGHVSHSDNYLTLKTCWEL